MDRNTVIQAIENCIDKPKCRDCPWETCEVDHEYVEMPLDLVQQALRMLKQQEPKPPIIKENSYGWKFYYCPLCGKEFYQNNKFNFCEKCGQAVKWK